METIIAEIQCAIEKAEWNINYHKNEMEKAQTKHDQLVNQLQDLNELLDTKNVN